MIFIKWLVSLLWGGGATLTNLTEAFNKAYAAKLNATTEHERIEAQANIDRLHALAADTANARQSMKDQPWWMALLAFLFGIGFAIHVFFIGIGTAFQPLIVGTALDWLLRIPPLPRPYDTAELGIIGFFFGYASVAVGTKAIAGAILGRK